MKMRFLVACAFASGCGVLAPDAKTSADRAHEVEPQCTGVTDDTLARITAPASISAVEPAYSYALGGPNGREARLRGARIHLQPALSGTKGGLTRTLQCHQARVLLGKSQSPANDPYALPDQWLDIDVNAGDDGFVVEVAAAETDDARLVLDRARQYSQQML
jgi:hypothetical protein